MMNDGTNPEEGGIRHAWQREEPHGVPSVRRGIVRVILAIFFSACALLALLDLLIHRKVEHSWERLPFFYALYGFLGSVFLVLTAKELRHLLMRSEDHYDAE